MSKYIVAGKYGFLTQAMLEERSSGKPIDLLNQQHYESRDVRDAFQFADADSAGFHRFDATDGIVLKIV